MRTLFSALVGVSLVGFLLLSFIYRTEEIDNKPIILGHGGSGVRSIHPLNSIGSIKEAFELGADGVEIDVRMSLDGKLFAFNSSRDDEDCTSSFESLSSQEISKCEAESWIQSSPVNTLRKTLQSAIPAGKLVSLDLKAEESPSHIRLDQFANAITSLLNQHTQIKFLLESENVLLLKRIQHLKPEARLFLNVKEINPKLDLIDLGFEGVVIHLDNLSNQTLRELKKSDIKRMVWGVGNVFDNRKAVGLNAKIIQTDDLGSMNQILK